MANGNDIITDFVHGTDKIVINECNSPAAGSVGTLTHFDSSTAPSYCSAVQSGADTLVTLYNGLL